MKLLIVKTSSLGDIIHTFPVAGYLREQFPDAEIDWVVERGHSELVEANPHITKTIPVDTKAWRRGKELAGFSHFRRDLRSKTYDVIFDLQGNFKSGLITFLAKGKQKVGFARESVPEVPNILFTKIRFNPTPGKNIREDYLSIVQQFYEDKTPFIFQEVKLSIDPDNCIQPNHNYPVLVCPGSSWKNKQVSEDTLIKFLHDFQKESNCHFYFGWGSLSEKEFSQHLAGEFSAHGTLLEHLSLPYLQHFMGQMKLVIAMDSLPLHLAATTNTATFSIFGPSAANKYAPIGAHHISLQGKCPYGKTFEKRCPILRTCETGACIRSLTAEDLNAKISEVREETRR